MSEPSVRDKIMEAGLAVMHANGFNGCSVQDITDAAGVPKGSFYNYFKSKEALAVEVLGVYQGHIDSRVLADRSKPPLERLRAHFKLAVGNFKSNGFIAGCLLGNLGAEMSDASEPVRKALVKRYELWHRGIAHVLREGQSTGEVAASLDTDRMARFMVTAWQGALLQMKTTKSAQPLEDFLELAFAPLHP